MRGGGSDHAESDGTVSSDRDGLSDAGADDGRKTSCDDRRADGAEFSAERIEQPCEKGGCRDRDPFQRRDNRGNEDRKPGRDKAADETSCISIYRRQFLGNRKNLFASILAGGMARGEDLFETVELAGTLIGAAMADAAEEKVPRNEGANYEKYLGMLIPGADWKNFGKRGA